MAAANSQTTAREARSGGAPIAPPDSGRKWRQAYLATEFCLVFVGLPLAYRAGWIPLPMIPTLLLAAMFAFLVLWRDPGFDRRNLWRPTPGATLKFAHMLTTFLTAAFVLWLVVAVAMPERMFGFVRAKPGWWALVLLLYPVLSVYPQELL